LITEDANSIIETIKNISGTFGGINLEDIAAPDCFIIEQKLKEILIFLYFTMTNTEQQL
jgi:malate dehydrogenase (oxaloacetate-decarboxylating)(NADP+)